MEIPVETKFALAKERWRPSSESNRTRWSLRPSYAKSFRCIGPACEDTCCAGWSVPIDKDAFDRYQSLPESPFRVLIHESITPNEENPTPATFALIRMNQQSQCPMLSEDRLCRVQSE